MSANRRFLLVRRPNGRPVPEDFSLVETAIPEPVAGTFVVRNHYASLDPAQRGWMDDVPSYAPPIALGDPVRASTVGQVHASAHPNYAPGDWIVGTNAIEDFSLVLPSEFIRRVDPSTVDSPTRFLSALGSVGLTAYFGLLADGKPQSGETVLVSGGAGAVGSVVGQIAKIKGCRTIGIAGGADKCARLKDDFGYDVAIDYRGKSVAQLSAEIAAAAPEGVNIVFENIGGDILDAALLNLAMNARVIICGMISEYNSPEKVGARNVWQLLVKRATMKGFLVRDHIADYPSGAAQMAAWIKDGKLRMDEDVQVGIENAHAAFMRLFSGANTGKLILKIAA